jgi:hypothetical protein
VYVVNHHARDHLMMLAAKSSAAKARVDVECKPPPKGFQKVANGVQPQLYSSSGLLF